MLLAVTRMAAAQTEAPPPAAPPPAEAPAAPAPAPEPAPAPAPAAEPAPPSVAPAPAPIAPVAPPPAEAPPVPPAPPADAKPPAPPPVPLMFGGSIWSRYEARGGFEEHGLTNARLHREGDYVVSRARLSLKTGEVDVGDGVFIAAAFVPQAAYTWGENTGANPTTTDFPGLALYEGYASVGTKKYRLDVGRFAMNYGDALVIGDVGWSEVGRAFNGARLRITPTETPAYIDGFVSIINEGRLVTQKPVSGDNYFWGVYAGLGPLLVKKKFDLDLYWLNFSTARSSRVPLTGGMPPTTVVGDQDAAWEATLGARVKGATELLDYRAEAGYQFGTRSVAPTFARPEPADLERGAYQIDAEIGVTPVKGFRIGIEGLMASGDDLETLDKNEGYNELYPTGHKWLGLTDVIVPRTNITSAVLHLKAQPTEAWSLMADAHYFAQPEKDALETDGSLGSEIDVFTTYAIGRGAELKALYGVFLPAEEYWLPRATSEDVAGNPIHYFELQFGIDFK
ncbi:MAG TPA: alginate export family protein [Polyangiaceae bacterium]